MDKAGAYVKTEGLSKGKPVGSISLLCEGENKVSVAYDIAANGATAVTPGTNAIATSSQCVLQAANTQIIATTRRLRSARLTNWSIIEQHPALDDDALAGLEPAFDNGLIALLETDLDGTGLERPGRNLDEHLVGFVLQHQRQ